VNDIAVILLAIAVILMARKQWRLARAQREQAELIHEAFLSISFVVEQLNATPAERSNMQRENLERLRLLIRTAAVKVRPS
jgi:hypothetical protein